MVAVGFTLDVAENVTLVWWSRRRRPSVGVEALVGATAVVVTACRPRGQVRVVGELWQAVCDPGADPGDLVEVIAVNGLTLAVAPRFQGVRPS